jgi:hypothetical protein
LACFELGQRIDCLRRQPEPAPLLRGVDLAQGVKVHAVEAVGRARRRHGADGIRAVGNGALAVAVVLVVDGLELDAGRISLAPLGDVLEAERRRESKAEAELRKLRGKVCFRTKAAMVKALTQANEHITERCETDSTGVEFEAINHKYDRHGKRTVTNCTDAIRAVSPTRPPYCLDRVDLDTLSEIDAAKKRGGFRLPPQAVDALTELEARQRHEDDEEYGAPGRPEPRPYELEGMRRLIRPRRRR